MHCGLAEWHTSRPWLLAVIENLDHLSCGRLSATILSIFRGSLVESPSKRETTLEKWVSTTIPGSPRTFDLKQLAVFLPTPGRETKSSMEEGTMPLYFSQMALEQSIMCFALELKNPVLCIMDLTSSISAEAKADALGYEANSTGATLLTVSSVVCALRMTEMRN